MFGRRNQSREHREAAEREQSRRALFEELAKRPANICPFLGLASSQTEYHDGFTREHRCYAFGDPVELSVEQQERVCLGRGYGNCPRYLRGVLVIPTEELEALRRPLPPVRPPVTPPPSATATRNSEGGGRRGLSILIGAVLLLVVAGAVGALVLFRAPGVGPSSPSPSPSVGPSASPTASASQQPSPTPEASNQTPFPETPKPDPTPLPGDTFQGFEVTVLEGENTLFEVDDDGNIVRSEIAHFSRFSKAPVDRIMASNGLLHWRTTEGFFTGLSYIHDRSGAFLIRKVYEGADGGTRYIILKDEEI